MLNFTKLIFRVKTTCDVSAIPRNNARPDSLKKSCEHKSSHVGSQELQIIASSSLASRFPFLHAGL